MMDEEYYSQDLDIAAKPGAWMTSKWRSQDLLRWVAECSEDKFEKDICYWFLVRQKFLDDYGGTYKKGCQ
jgi:hypothetical protein